MICRDARKGEVLRGILTQVNRARACTHKLGVSQRGSLDVRFTPRANDLLGSRKTTRWANRDTVASQRTPANRTVIRSPRRHATGPSLGLLDREALRS